MINKDELHSRIAAEQQNLCGLTILQGGKEILRDTWNGWTKDDRMRIDGTTR